MGDGAWEQGDRPVLSVVDGSRFSRGWTWLSAFVVILAALSAMAPCVWNDFVPPDEELFLKETPFRESGPLDAAWLIVRGKAYPDHSYYPVVHLVFGIDVLLFNGRSELSFAFNLAIHTANALLVWWILRLVFASVATLSFRLRLTAAALGAALFAAHPINVESVAWIAGRDILLAFFFAALSVVVFLKGSGSWASSVLASLCLALSLLSNASTLSVPMILASYWLLVGTKVSGTFCRNGPEGASHKRFLTPSDLRSHAVRLAPLFAVMIVGVALRASATDTDEAKVFRTASLWLEHLGLGLCAQGQHLLVLFFPKTLHFNYPLVELAFWSWRGILGAVFAAGTVVAVGRLGRSDWIAHRVMAFGLTWYWLAVLPTFIHRFSIADRHTYLAAVGLFLNVGLIWTLLLKWLSRRRPMVLLAVAVTGLLLGTLVVRCRAQSRLWCTESAIYMYTRFFEPHETRPFFILCGTIFIPEGSDSVAAESFGKSLEGNDMGSAILTIIGRRVWAQGGAARSLPYFKEALRLNPYWVPALDRLSQALSELGHHAQAMACYREGLERAERRGDRALAGEIRKRLEALAAGTDQAE